LATIPFILDRDCMAFDIATRPDYCQSIVDVACAAAIIALLLAASHRAVEGMLPL
jgi:hypothetical protein